MFWNMYSAREGDAPEYVNDVLLLPFLLYYCYRFCCTLVTTFAAFLDSGYSLRISDESRGELMRFYKNQMDARRADQQKLIDAAVAQMTKSFEEQIAKLIAERDAALLSAKRLRGKMSKLFDI